SARASVVAHPPTRTKRGHALRRLSVTTLSASTAFIRAQLANWAPKPKRAHVSPYTRWWALCVVLCVVVSCSYLWATQVAAALKDTASGPGAGSSDRDAASVE